MGSLGEDGDDDVDHVEDVAGCGVLGGGGVQLLQQGLQPKPKQLLLQVGVRVRQRECAHALTNHNYWGPANHVYTSYHTLWDYVYMYIRTCTWKLTCKE